MAASYPASVKTWANKTDNVDNILAAHVNGLYDEVIAVETSKIKEDAWKGVIVGCSGDGNPNTLLDMMSGGSIIEATPTLITASIARICYFRLDTALTYNKIRFFGIGAVTTTYIMGIYNGDTLARIYQSGSFTTASQAWGAIGSALNLTLSANQLYFAAVSVNTTGTTAGIKCFGATTGRLGVLPKSWPGNLNIDTAKISPFGAQGQGAVTTGALPDPFPTVALLGTMACGMPAFFLDSSNA